MKTGAIILVPFPFSELTNIKVHPAVVIGLTKDKYADIIVCAISSVIPEKQNQNEILLKPNYVNNLRVESIIKIDRIVTLKKESKIADLGKLFSEELILFRKKFCDLISTDI